MVRLTIEASARGSNLGSLKKARRRNKSYFGVQGATRALFTAAPRITSCTMDEEKSNGQPNCLRVVVMAARLTLIQEGDKLCTVASWARWFARSISVGEVADTLFLTHQAYHLDQWQAYTVCVEGRWPDSTKRRVSCEAPSARSLRRTEATRVGPTCEDSRGGSPTWVAADPDL